MLTIKSKTLINSGTYEVIPGPLPGITPYSTGPTPGVVEPIDPTY